MTTKTQCIVLSHVLQAIEVYVASDEDKPDGGIDTLLQFCEDSDLYGEDVRTLVEMPGPTTRGRVKAYFERRAANSPPDDAPEDDDTPDDNDTDDSDDKSETTPDD